MTHQTIPVPVELLVDEDKTLRRMLCVAVCGLSAYMDDGEASDASVHPNIDFLRDSPKDIQRKIWERNRAALQAAPAQVDVNEQGTNHVVSQIHPERRDNPAQGLTDGELADNLKRFERAVGRKDVLHHIYSGKAMPDDMYQTFITLRDDAIPALRESILAAIQKGQQS